MVLSDGGCLMGDFFEGQSYFSPGCKAGIAIPAHRKILVWL